MPRGHVATSKTARTGTNPPREPRTSARDDTARAEDAAADWCAIDFGTSNSAVAVPRAGGGVTLVPLEGGHVTMPTAVFYRADGPAGAPPVVEFGRAALAAYVDGLDGRLMRSMKSILGSSLLDQATDVGGGRSLSYAQVLAGYLRHLKQRAEAATGTTLRRALLGRPVYFVDDDPARDAAAQAALATAATAVGFEAVAFQFEPIAAALDHEATLAAPEIVLVADIGGGTSDFSVLRAAPARRLQADRRADILANHGVHRAGTDFDRHISLATIMPLLGYGTQGPARAGGAPAREVPRSIYLDLATWHLINTVYAPSRVAEWRGMASFFADVRLHARLMHVLRTRAGHALAAAAEAAKIATAEGGSARLELDMIEDGLDATLDEAGAGRAIERDGEPIEQAARETIRLAGLSPEDVDTLYLTGGSTGLTPLVARIARQVPRARVVRGDPFASVARGLGAFAALRFA